MEFVVFLNLPIYIIALFLVWGSVNGRWFILSLLFLEIIDMTLLPLFAHLQTPYYALVVLLNTVFLIGILGRQYWASILFKYTRVRYFSEATRQYALSPHEAAICLLFFMSLVVNLVAGIEVWLYLSYFIDRTFVVEYILNPVQILVHILECLVVIAYITKPFKAKRTNKYDYIN